MPEGNTVTDYIQSDAMIARLEGELSERNAFIQGLIGSAQDANRDLSEGEIENINNAKDRITQLNSQLTMLGDSRELQLRARENAAKLHRDMAVGRRQIDKGEVEYRSAGAYLLDTYKSALGDREASDRLEVFTRAAAHQKTSDNLGVVPDPILGPVINFVDGARPVVSLLGPRDLPGATWYRPKVTARTNVAVQGVNGAATDEKAELVSQKMTIGRLTGNAVTYGGYVNVSRQNIDFSSPNALDIIIQDLANEYAIETEAATAAELNATVNTVEIEGATGSDPTEDALVKALWAAAGNIYNAVKGAGRLFVAVPPGMLGVWGRLFAPVNPQNAQSTGFSAGDFGQGVMGNVSGIPLVVTAGLPAGTTGVVGSTAAIEVYEQRVGQLQAVEPSVLGVQVAYAGYFTPMVIEAGGLQKLVNVA